MVRLKKGNQVLSIWQRVNKLFEPRKRTCVSCRMLFSSAEMFEASLTNSVDPDHIAHVGVSDLGPNCLPLYLC